MTSHPTLAWLRLGFASLLAALVLPGGAAHAQYPTKPIRVLVGYAPASGADAVARIMVEGLQEAFKQGVVIENKAGAGGRIAAREFARAAPDGYTLLLAAMPETSIAPATNPNLGYNPQRDFAPVTQLVATDLVLLVNPQRVPTGSLQQFVAWGKEQKSLFFATPGPGTGGHFGSHIFADAVNVRIEPVHFKAAGDAMTALLAGDVHAQFVPLAVAAPQVRAGTLKALVATGPVRSPIFPDVPTFKEAGFPEVQFDSWYGVFAPVNTPPEILDKLNAEFLKVARAPDTRARLEKAGLRLTGTTRDEFARLIKDDALRWGAVVKATGFKTQE